MGDTTNKPTAVFPTTRNPFVSGIERYDYGYKKKGEGTATFPTLVAPRGFEPRFDG